jgi:hypothetical protein
MFELHTDECSPCILMCAPAALLQLQCCVHAQQPAKPFHAVDLRRTYIKPECSPKETILVSRICVCVFGCLMGILAVLLNVAGVSLGWVRKV